MGQRKAVTKATATVDEVSASRPVGDKLVSMSAATIDRRLAGGRARLRLKGSTSAKGG